MDSRFDTSSWGKVEAEAGPSSKPFSIDQSDHQGDCIDQHDDFLTDQADQDDFHEDDLDQGRDQDSKPHRLLSPSDQPTKKKKSKGIIYISRIPPGMTPPKVRHLLEGFGDVERIYLQDGREKERKRGNEGRISESRSRSAHYTEGWVEFSSKRVAKIVAENLNAQPIGVIGGAGTGRKGKGSRGIKGREKSRWKDDIWTMKYLSGYKWEMLSSQLANERASHAARLRNELSQDAFEQKDYLKKVERARVEREKQEKKRKRSEKSGLSLNEDNADEVSKSNHLQDGIGGKKKFTFKQRAPIKKDVRDQTSSDKDGEMEAASNSGNKKRKREVQNGKSRELKGGLGIEAKEQLSGVLSKIF